MEWEGARPFLPGAREGDGVTLSPAPVNAWREHRALTVPSLLADWGRRNAHHQLRFGHLPGRVAPCWPRTSVRRGTGDTDRVFVVAIAFYLRGKRPESVQPAASRYTLTL